MRVLFVGEGPHDVGRHDRHAHDRRDTPGVLQVLARKVVPSVSEDSPAIYWKEIALFDPNARKQGLHRKVAAAVLLSERKHRCTGTVVVVDQDANGSRRSDLEAACEQTRHDHPLVPGVAVESIEAWTLGALEAIAAVLGVKEVAVRRELPTDCAFEALYENSGKEDRRPKRLLDRVAGLRGRDADTEFRCEVAHQTDISALAKSCPDGFGRFADSLRRSFSAGANPTRHG